MNKEDVISVLNSNVESFNFYDTSNIITEYLKEKGIEENRSHSFINYIINNPLMAFNDTLLQCLNVAIKYFINKYEINYLSTQDTVIYYF